MIDEDKSLWDFHETENRQSFVLARPRLDFISKRIARLAKEGSVLDVGIGDGYLLSLLSGRYAAYGLDISPMNIERTRKEFEQKRIRAELKVGSIDGMPFKDHEFDFVVASDVLEHLAADVLERALHEINRILKKGGILICTVPADENLDDSLCYCPKCGNEFHRWGHKQAFSREAIRMTLISKGFIVGDIRRITFFGVQMPQDSLVSRIKLRIGKLLFALLKRVFAPQWWFYVEARKQEPQG